MIDIAEDQNLNEDNDTPEQKKPGALGSLWLFVWDFLKIFIIALAIIIPIRFYLFQPFIVTGQSMLPNFEDGQYLVIDEISYRFTSPQRGEVTVIRSPNDDSQFFIKRIIGLPGETIEISVKIKNTQTFFSLIRKFVDAGIIEDVHPNKKRNNPAIKTMAIFSDLNSLPSWIAKSGYFDLSDK